METLLLENIAVKKLSNYFATGTFDATDVIINEIGYNEYNTSMLACPDIIDACKGLYGFLLTSDHTYISCFGDSKLIRFKYRNISDSVSTLATETLPTIGPLKLLMPDTEQILGFQSVIKNFNYYPLVRQFTDLKIIYPDKLIQ